MWAVVQVDEGYPALPPMAVSVRLFEFEKDAQAWADRHDDGHFIVNVLQVSPVWAEDAF